MLLCWIYPNFLIFDVYISQGSVSTQLRCSGKTDNDFIENSMPILKVKEFLKSVNIRQSYERIILLFFDSQCIILEESYTWKRYKKFLFSKHNRANRNDSSCTYEVLMIFSDLQTTYCNELKDSIYQKYLTINLAIICQVAQPQFYGRNKAHSDTWQ